MKQTVFLRLLADGPQVHWLLVDDESQRQGQADSLAMLIDSQPGLKNVPAVILAPGEKVLTLAVEVPPRWSQDILNYAVEEQISSPPEEVFVCPLGLRNSQGQLPVAVVDRQLLGQWCSQLQSVGIKVLALLPDFLALPYREGEHSALYDEDRVLVRTGEYQGVAVQSCWLEDWIFLQDSSLVRSAIDDPVKSTEPVLVRLSRSWTNQGINLLQGEFRMRPARGSMRSFTPALVMLGVALVIQTALFTWDSVQLVQEKQRLDQQIREKFQQVMGVGARQVKPVQQLKSRLAELESTGENSLFNDLNTLLQVWPSEGARLAEINYSQGQLQVALEVNQETWPRLQQSLLTYPPVTIKQVSSQTDTNDQNVQEVVLEVDG